MPLEATQCADHLRRAAGVSPFSPSSLPSSLVLRATLRAAALQAGGAAGPHRQRAGGGRPQRSVGACAVAARGRREGAAGLSTAIHGRCAHHLRLPLYQAATDS